MNVGKPSQTEEAEAALAQGLGLFRAQDAAGAHAAFERAHRRDSRDPRAISWYGLTLALVEKNWSLAIGYCDQAARSPNPEPIFFLNQARVHLALSQRERAVRALTRGLEAFPDDPALRLAQETMGTRHRPMFSFLPRGNVLNIWLGRLRHRLTRRRANTPALSPLTLGVLPEDQA
jgi:tetratricopeptide (TPR) repeat protein